jgi:hypothetical protein
MLSAPETSPFRARRSRGPLLAKERLNISSSLFDVSVGGCREEVPTQNRNHISGTARGKCAGDTATDVRQYQVSGAGQSKVARTE